MISSITSKAFPYLLHALTAINLTLTLNLSALQELFVMIFSS
jgi:hypothetical protein